MIYAGVDVAKADHVIGAVDERGSELCKPMGFKNGAAGFERCGAWLEGVAEEPGDVLVGMEATGHYWMALYAFLVSRGYAVAVIDPVQVRAVRRLRGLDRVKNDRIDAVLIAETLRIGQYDPTRLATDEVQSLRTLTRYHQSLKSELAEVKTQCTCLLDSYFPSSPGRSPTCSAPPGGRCSPRARSRRRSRGGGSTRCSVTSPRPPGAAGAWTARPPS